MAEQPRTREVLNRFPSYRPGRSAEEVARELGIARVVKLASNESAFGPLPAVVTVVAEAATAMNRYPDNGAGRLRAALAERFGVDPGQVTTGCGSVGLCQELVQATLDAGDAALYGWRSFEAYPIVVAVAGGRSAQVPLTDETYDLDAMAAALGDDVRLVFLCNPNNPTGTAVGRDAILRFLDAVPRDVLVVYDEAYCEFVRDPDVPDGMELLRAYPNVAVLRTFSKAYGLAGLRVGYCVAAAEVADAVAKTHVPFSVSTVAQAAALASLEPTAEAQLAERVELVVAERARVTEKLRGAITRPFAGDGVRVTIGAPDENDVFLGVAEAALAESGAAPD